LQTLESVVLASASPRRRELLGSLGLSVEIVGSSYVEAPLPGRTPVETAVAHARGKLAGATPRRTLTIAADTVVDLDGAALGKPRDDVDARAMLTALSGRDHRVHTAFALRDAAGDVRHVEAVTTTVRFLPLDPATIDAYVASGDPRDKAGSYGIQGFAATLVERVDGDYFTVVGFPLAAFARALPALGYRLEPLIAAGAALAAGAGR
jgi:septum formation protein